MTESSSPPTEWQRLHQQHSRTFHDNKFVYPVLSRRSRGLSLGINLNPDKVCNFDCIYCQVDRRSESETQFVELDRLAAELESLLATVTSGAIYADPAFSSVPEDRRRLNDLAFSGDGEPTTFRNFDDIVQLAANLKRQFALDDVKLVLITNASMLHKPVVQRGLAILDRNQGEIWAKLDAGTEAYYQQVERTRIPFAQVLDNITLASQQRPIVLQSLFMRIAGQGPSSDEIAAYAGRIREFGKAGGKIDRVQVYTVARPPAEGFVTPLTRDELEVIATAVRQTDVAADVFAS